MFDSEEFTVPEILSITWKKTKVFRKRNNGSGTDGLAYASMREIFDRMLTAAVARLPLGRGKVYHNDYFDTTNIQPFSSAGSCYHQYLSSCSDDIDCLSLFCTKLIFYKLLV